MHQKAHHYHLHHTQGHCSLKRLGTLPESQLVALIWAEPQVSLMVPYTLGTAALLAILRPLAAQGERALPF